MRRLLTQSSYIVKDVYNAKMLAAWDEYKAQWTSENTRPSCFAPEQLYLVLCLSDGGYDLESTAFDKDAGWRQAASVFWQVSRALAAAEDELEFEVSICLQPG
jgi:serine/threonine-protein kinase haspin